MEKNWHTFANFAFASSAQPGASDETQCMKGVVTPLLGEAEALRLAVRRLYWTAHTYVTADMKVTIERTGDEAPRKMSVEEREARRSKVVPHLHGLDVDDYHDPSHGLVDVCHQMYEENAVNYPAWELSAHRARKNAEG